MDQSSSSTLLHFKWLLIAVVVASLGLALTQPAIADISADEAFGTVLSLQKKISDEASNGPLDDDTSFDVLLASSELTGASRRSWFSTPLYLAASYLAAFIRPSPRGPPLV